MRGRVPGQRLPHEQTLTRDCHGAAASPQDCRPGQRCLLPTAQCPEGSPGSSAAREPSGLQDLLLHVWEWCWSLARSSHSQPQLGTATRDLRALGTRAESWQRTWAVSPPGVLSSQVTFLLQRLPSTSWFHAPSLELRVSWGHKTFMGVHSGSPELLRDLCRPYSPLGLFQCFLKMNEWMITVIINNNHSFPLILPSHQRNGGVCRQTWRCLVKSLVRPETTTCMSFSPWSPASTNTLALPLLRLKEFDRPPGNVLIDTVFSWLDRLGLEMMI